MDTGERAYEKIINYVEQQVMHGRYKKGDKLPSERELAALLGASRNSVREGLGILERMGAISSQQGAGNFISDNFEKTLIREAERNGIEIEVLDLDHDLGDFASQGGDAIKLLDWLAERETFYPVEIHTANPVGRANMESVLARYWGEEYW